MHRIAGEHSGTLGIQWILIAGVTDTGSGSAAWRRSGNGFGALLDRIRPRFARYETARRIKRARGRQRAHSVPDGDGQRLIGVSLQL